MLYKIARHLLYVGCELIELIYDSRYDCRIQFNQVVLLKCRRPTLVRIRQQAFHAQRATVWRAMWSVGVIEPFFF